MKEFLNNPVFLLAATFGAYYGAQQLRKRVNTVLLNPVLVSVLVLIAFLRIAGVHYESYAEGSKFISFFLKPAIVALGVPLYQQLGKIKKQTLTIVLSQLAGCFVSTTSVILIAYWMGAPAAVIYSLAPKSVTTPIAMEVSKALGGLPPLTASVVIVVGIFGSMVGYPVLRHGQVLNPVSQGLSMGTAAHAVGTSRSLEISPRYGAFSSLGLILNGVFTAVLAPYILKLLHVWIRF